MIERVSVCVSGGLFLALAISACSSDDKAVAPPADAGAGFDANRPTDPGVSYDAGDVATDSGASDAGRDGEAGTGPVTPCSMVAGANGLGTKKMQMLGTEVATGGVVKDGVYRLKYWGKQSSSVGVAYELEVNLTLKLGTPNTWAVGEYYMAGDHSGGGTFTVDEAAKTITFTKTCGEINVGLGDPNKASYSVTADEFKLFNFGLYAGGNILIFNAPL